MSTGISASGLVSIAPRRARRESSQGGQILLFKPPYFTPWTPPLGISILKSFLRPHGYSVRCFDFNTDPELWGMHHKYFAAIQTLEDVSINDGYSKLWWILNAHMLAYANGADNEACARVLETVIPLYGIPKDAGVIKALLPLVEKFYRQLGEIIESLDLMNYSVAGTSTYSTSLGPSLFLLRKIKEKHPHIKTVMGGGIFADDLALGSDNLDTLLHEYEYVDHVILGEGEMLFLKLLDGELSHKRAISIADLKGETLEMKDVPPPDFSDMRLDNYYHLTIEGARSCPFQCSFCSETIQWGDYRKKPIDLFADQVMELAASNGNRSFFMGDSLMNPYVAQFARELLNRNANILYDGYMRADKPVTHRDRTDMWAKSGLYRVRLGIESASAQVLDTMDKMTTPTVISDALRSLATAGIRNTTYWIVGFPGETEDDFEESLEFIRENHRNIYELEAHPYYYYPYGQIGSRLYECRSLYPDEVTEIIKFKVWDILDVQPTRHERYERLRRISDLASKLGLPNIYTMSDRYQAEDRWLMLHPLTTLVYEGRHPHRKELTLKGEIGVYTDECITSGLESTHCHRLSVQKVLDEETLAKAVSLLKRYNEMLGVGLRGGIYVPCDSDDSEVLSVHEADEGGDEERWVIENLASKIDPEAGSSLRVALIKRGSSCDVLLLVHRAFADSKGTVMLCEDLFRLYEQLSYGKEISLRPSGKTYSEFMNGQSAIDIEISEPRRADATQKLVAETEVISLGRKVAKEINSEVLKQFGITPQSVMLAALLKCLSEEEAGDAASFYVKVDCRHADKTLENTMANLTRTWALSSKFVERATDIRHLKGALHQLVSVADVNEKERGSEIAERAEPVLLNLEYFIEEPWVEADAWRSGGFIIEGHRLESPYALEIAPVFGDEVKIVMKSRNFNRPHRLAARISERIGVELEAVLQRLRDHIVANEYWLREFGKNDGTPNIQTESGRVDSSQVSLTSSEFQLSAEVTRLLQDGCGASLSEILLAAYGMLISSLNGREEITVAAYLVSHEGHRVIAPMKLLVSSDLSFLQLVERVAYKSAQMKKHATESFEILADELPNAEAGRAARPVFDVGFVFANAGEADEALNALEGRLKSYQGTETIPVLFLEATGTEAGADLRLKCMKNLFGQGSEKKLTGYLRTILEQASVNVNVPLERIKLERQTGQGTIPQVLADDTFNFGEA